MRSLTRAEIYIEFQNKCGDANISLYANLLQLNNDYNVGSSVQLNTSAGLHTRNEQTKKIYPPQR